MLCLSINKGEVLMEQIKEAVKALEQAVLHLETAVHSSKKAHTRSAEEIMTLKTAIRTAHDRMDKALTKFKQGDH